MLSKKDIKLVPRTYSVKSFKVAGKPRMFMVLKFFVFLAVLATVAGVVFLSANHLI